MRRSPADGEVEVFLYVVGIVVRMDVPVKPKCYDSVPACLCMDCQLYDVKQMVSAKSSIVSSRSPFLPRYAASLLSRPSAKSAPCAVSSALSSRPSCSVAECTYGLADVDRPMFLSRPRLDFADLSSPCFVPACDSASPVSSVPPVRAVPAPHVSSVGVPPVCSAVSVAVPPVRSSSVPPSWSSSVAVPFRSVSAPSSAVTASPGFGCSVSSVASRPVYVPPVVAPSVSAAAPPGFRTVAASPSFGCSVSSVVSRPVYVPPVVAPSVSVAAPPGLRPAFVSPSPVGSAPSPVRSALSGPVHRCPVSSFAQLLCPAFVQPSPYLPLACLVFVVVPVLLSTPFGFVLSFLPVLR